MRDINVNDLSHWKTLFVESVIESSQLIQASYIDIVIQLYDIYGHPIGFRENHIGDMSICSHYKHPRLVIYFTLKNKSQDSFYDINDSDFSIISEFYRT